MQADNLSWVVAPLDLAALKAPFAAELAEVETRLLAVAEAAPAVFAPVADSLLTRGKRLRPLLVLLAAGSAPGPATVVLATAVEQIHLASLIHDDIIDEAEERRGRPAVHTALGRRKAVLAGDYLAAAAYRELSAVALPDAAEAFTGALLAMTLAEVRAVGLAGTLPAEAEYLQVAEGKTAALFAAAAYGGALAGGLAAEAAAGLREYGRRLGMAFQIRDDLLDLYGDAERLGKPVRSDLAAGLYTLPVIHTAGGPAGAELRAQLEVLWAHPGRGELAEEIAALTREAGGEAYAEAAMYRYAEQATAALPECAYQERLAALAGYAVKRAR